MTRLSVFAVALVALVAFCHGASVPVKDRELSDETTERQLWRDSYYGRGRGRGGYYRSRPYYREYYGRPSRYYRRGYRTHWDAPAPASAEGGDTQEAGTDNQEAGAEEEPWWPDPSAEEGDTAAEGTADKQEGGAGTDKAGADTGGKRKLSNYYGYGYGTGYRNVYYDDGYPDGDATLGTGAADEMDVWTTDTGTLTNDRHWYYGDGY